MKKWYVVKCRFQTLIKLATYQISVVSHGLVSSKDSSNSYFITLLCDLWSFTHLRKIQYGFQYSISNFEIHGQRKAWADFLFCQRILHWQQIPSFSKNKGCQMWRYFAVIFQNLHLWLQNMSTFDKFFSLKNDSFFVNLIFIDKIKYPPIGIQSEVSNFHIPNFTK